MILQENSELNTTNVINSEEKDLVKTIHFKNTGDIPTKNTGGISKENNLAPNEIDAISKMNLQELQYRIEVSEKLLKEITDIGRRNNVIYEIEWLKYYENKRISEIESNKTPEEEVKQLKEEMNNVLEQMQKDLN